jgi:hypothetical protein
MTAEIYQLFIDDSRNTLVSVPFARRRCKKINTTPNTQRPTLNTQRRCPRESVKWGRAAASPPRRRHVVKGKRCQRAAGFALSAFSCREGSSSSSSSSSYSISEDEDEDEDERQPGFSFPVTPSFLRGEADKETRQGTGLNGAKLRGYCHLNRNLNLDLNLLVENGLRLRLGL